MTFNEGSRIDSGRVQRRGRGGGSSMAIGGGAGGLLIAVIFLIVQMLGGPAIDPNSLAGPGQAPQDETSQQDFEARCVTGADANEYSDCRVAGTIASLDSHWEQALPAVGVDLRFPGVVVFDESTQSACGPATSATGPFYCPLDESIYVDVTFFDVLSSEFGASSGPLAEMYVIAHEYGHHIQNQLGIFEIADRSGSGEDSDSVKVELMADCLAGVWAGYAATTPDDSGTPYLQPLTEQDVADALSAAESVGDDRIQEASGGRADPHTFTHGSSEQRMAAFKDGYERGTVAACDAFGVVNR